MVEIVVEELLKRDYEKGTAGREKKSEPKTTSTRGAARYRP